MTNNTDRRSNTDTTIPAAKKARMENSSNVVQELKMDAAVAKAVELIEHDEDNLNKIIDEQSEAIIKLEQEYVAKLTPIYAKRSDNCRNIPDFWATAFQNHPILGQLIDEQDEEVLKSLKEIRVDLVNKDVKIPEGNPKVKTLNYAVHFIFGENDYFTDKEIIKSFYQLGDHIVSSTAPAQISWKKDKDLIKLTSPEGNATAEGDDEAESTCTSFFGWFEDHDDAEHDEIGEHIREDLWAHALVYYLNEDEEDDDEDDEVDLEDEEEEEDETAEWWFGFEKKWIKKS